MTPDRIAELRALRNDVLGDRAACLDALDEALDDVDVLIRIVARATQRIVAAEDAIERVRALALAWPPEARDFHTAIRFLNALEGKSVDHSRCQPLLTNAAVQYATEKHRHPGKTAFFSFALEGNSDG